MRRFFIVLGASSTLVGCVDPTSALHPRSRHFRAAADFMDGPSDPGPFVVRIGDDPFFALIDTDRSTGLAVVIRLPAPGVSLIPCGGSTNLDAASLQLVVHASGAINQLMIGRDVHAFVYQRASFVAAVVSGGLCHAIATQVPIASGVIDFTAYDSDTFLSGTHADAFGWSARGLMTGMPGGASLRFQDTSHGVLAADGSLINFVNSISLTPSP